MQLRLASTTTKKNSICGQRNREAKQFETPSSQLYFLFLGRKEDLVFLHLYGTCTRDEEYLLRYANTLRTTKKKLPKKMSSFKMAKKKDSSSH